MGEAQKVENLFALATPVFFIFIGIELVASLITKRKVYRLNDSISDLSAGMFQELVGVFTKVLLFGVYYTLYEKYRFFTMPIHIVTWIAVFLLIDFTYYWFHRNSHNIAIVWGSHEAHHSSQEYNLSVALRQGAFQRLFSFPYNLPLAVLGFSPFQFVICSQVNTLYQFFIHTRLIKKLGFLEWFMNTPSHHRVHHGVNPKYIDKNHAGVLIIWDKLFGTFQAEEEEPYYGTVKPLTTFNPVWAQLHYWVELFQLSRQCRGFDKILVWFKGPGWKPDYLGGKSSIPEINPKKYQKFDVAISRSLTIYAAVVFLVTLPFFLVLQQTKGAEWSQQVMLAACAILGLAVAGGLFQKRKWAYVFEYLRIALFLAVVFFLASSQTGLALFFVLAGVSAVQVFFLVSKKSIVLSS